MAFKVSHAERENITRVTTLDVPKDFLDLMNAELAYVKADPTYEIVIEGDNPKEVALYLQWAKFWGMSLPEGERLSVFKLATKKGGSDKVARLQLKPFDPNGVQRGRKPSTKETPETPAVATTEAEKAVTTHVNVKADKGK